MEVCHRDFVWESLWWGLSRRAPIGSDFSQFGPQLRTNCAVSLVNEKGVRLIKGRLEGGLGRPQSALQSARDGAEGVGRGAHLAPDQDHRNPDHMLTGLSGLYPALDFPLFTFQALLTLGLCQSNFEV